MYIHFVIERYRQHYSRNTTPIIVAGYMPGEQIAKALKWQDENPEEFNDEGSH